MAENGIMPFLVNSTGAFYAANNNFSVDKDGKVITTPIHCYEIWGRNEPCENCISSRSLEGKEWVTKLEMRDRQMYFVLSKHINVNGRTCTLEIAFA